MHIERKKVIELAVAAAQDYEWGYDEHEARERLKEIDPDYDWEPELLQVELERGYRQMRPARPTSKEQRLLEDMYRRHMEEELKRMMEQHDLFYKVIDKGEFKVTDKRRFVIPIEYK